MKNRIKYTINKNSHWTLLTIALGSLLVIYFYLYLSTDFRHILISTDLGIENLDSDTLELLRRENNAQKPKKEAMFLEFSEVMIGPISLEDPRLVKYIQKNYLKPPAAASVPYNLSEDATERVNFGQSKEIIKVLGRMKNGFFIEAGAFDGESRSNTLFLEQKLGWTGLLLEPDPRNFKLLLQKNRKSWAINACLSAKPYPHQVVFYQNGNDGRVTLKDFSLTNTESQNNLLASRRNRNRRKHFVRAQCIPIISILLALNQSTIDYFSLNIGGVGEMEIIGAIPFEKVFIKVFSIEFPKTEGSSNEKFIKFMKSKGFKYRSELNYGNDLIFTNEKFNVSSSSSFKFAQ